jgi:PilZ domain-containing protein
VKGPWPSLNGCDPGPQRCADQMALSNQPERRRFKRTALQLSASAREMGRSRMAVRVIDICTHGCRIELSSGAIAEPWLLLTIAGLETQYGRVVWHENGFAGLEFAPPLNEDVLEALMDQQERATEAIVVELRRIANRAANLGSTVRDGGKSQTLKQLSLDCTLHAIIQALRLGELRARPEPQLTCSMIRRSADEHAD